MSSYKYLKSVKYFTQKRLDRLEKLTCEIEEENKMVDKFEIGDKVHFCYLDAHSDLFWPELTDVFDQEGIIVAIDGDYSLAVNFGNTTFELYIDWVELVEKAKKPWNGKVICISSVTAYFTEGKIYEVKNGMLYDNTKTPYNTTQYYDCPMTKFGANFIEFKGFANE